MQTQSLLLNTAGDADNGQTKTFVHLQRNTSPQGSYTVSFSTTYNKAKDPNAHQVKHSLFVKDRDALRNLALFLVSAD